MNRLSSSPPRFLLLEDEALVSMLIEDVLADLGCVVAAVVTNVADALAVIDAHERPFDAAILDVNLGGETAYPVAAVLTERRIPFAFATGYGQEGVGHEYASVPVVAKPFDETALQGVIQQLVRTGNRGPG